jgi:hypothetical protein
MARGFTAYFTSTARLFTKIRGTWSRNSEITEEQMLRQFEQIDLMILDEIGLQRGTDDEQRTLHELLEARRLELQADDPANESRRKEPCGLFGRTLHGPLERVRRERRFNWESHRRQSRDVAGLDRRQHEHGARDRISRRASGRRDDAGDRRRHRLRIFERRAVPWTTAGARPGSQGGRQPCRTENAMGHSARADATGI